MVIYNNEWKIGLVCCHCNIEDIKHGYIETNKGEESVCPGDYNIKDKAGNYYSCKPDVFDIEYSELLKIHHCQGCN